jgi:lysophospholipase L1-like esterase
VEPLHTDKPKIAGIGLAMSFAVDVMESGGLAPVGLVPCAVGGTPLSRWMPGADLYDSAVTIARCARKSGTLKGILWHQGEGDAGRVEDSASYGERFRTMIRQLREDLSAPSVPVIAGELGPFLRLHESCPHFGMINRQLRDLEGVLPAYACAGAAGLQDQGDCLHFSSAALREFGLRYARRFLALSRPGTGKSGRNLARRRQPKPLPGDEGIPAASAGTEGVEWVDAMRLTLAGRGWPEECRGYERLPARAEGRVPAKVWAQSCACAGLTVRFRSDAELFFVRWLDYNGLPAVNQAGPDRPVLYVRWRGRWTWVGTARQIDQGPAHRLLNDRIPPTRREYMLCLPIAHGMQKLEIGVPAGARLTPGRLPDSKPIVFYGTSITQGGAASRPGCNHVAIIERHFDCPVVNIGFSGSGRMEPEVVELVAELEASVFVLDCLPNMVAAEVTERFEPAIRLLRGRHPETPIVAVEGVPYEDGFLVTSRRARWAGSNRALRKGFGRLVKAGVPGLHYIPAAELFDGCDDATVDGTHPNELGFRLMANRFIQTLEPLLPPPPGVMR